MENRKPVKCECCPKGIDPEEKVGNFFIRIMNQAESNMFKGLKAINIYFCSWECLEKFEQDER